MNTNKLAGFALIKLAKEKQGMIYLYKYDENAEKKV